MGVVVVPGQVFLDEARGDTSPISVRSTSSVVCPDATSLAAAAAVLNSAKSVTILAGAGCQGAREEVVALAGALKAPIVHSLRSLRCTSSSCRSRWSYSTTAPWRSSSWK